jgi:hypothetical protein
MSPTMSNAPVTTLDQRYSSPAAGYRMPSGATRALPLSLLRSWRAARVPAGLPRA